MLIWINSEYVTELVGEIDTSDYNWGEHCCCECFDPIMWADTNSSFGYFYVGY